MRESNASRCAVSRRLDVAVVGAGLSGLACARTLVDHGHRVQVFDKARGPGGRMSTRRAETWRFDHGAQYFTVRDRRFAPWVDSWRRQGLVARWRGVVAVLEGGRTLARDEVTERFVGVPGMNAVCQHLAGGIDVAFETLVGAIERSDQRWRVVSGDDSDLGRFDVVVVSAPAPQTATLLEDAAPQLAARASESEMAPCWAVMAGFADSLDIGFDGAFVHGSPLSWVARNASKPERPAGEAWVLQASPEWSRQHLELQGEDVVDRLVEAFRDAVGGLESAPVYGVAHRWRFALPIEPLAAACLFDAELGLAACGDWCGGPRVEGAFLSGCAAAARIVAMGSDTG